MTTTWLRVLPIFGLLLSLIACSSLAGTHPRGEISPRIFVGQKIPDLAFLDLKGSGIRLYPPRIVPTHSDDLGALFLEIRKPLPQVGKLPLTLG